MLALRPPRYDDRWRRRRAARTHPQLVSETATTHAGEEAVAVEPAARLRALREVRLGVLDSGMNRTGAALDALVARLEAEYPFAEVRLWRKSTPYRGAPRKLLRELAEACDAVVSGVPD